MATTAQHNVVIEEILIAAIAVAVPASVTVAGTFPL